MLRVFNMRTYLLSLLKRISLVSLVSAPLVLALPPYTIIHQAVFIVIAQGITHHHSLVIVIMSWVS
jgi:hypothetical protein